MRSRLAALTAAFVLLPAAARAESTDIGEILVTARHLPPAASEVVLATTVVDAGTLAAAGDRRLDDVLRELPGFSLFRRQSSRASHPTTQGVTLRGLGPSGAGRTLLLLDGVPQNDPFGGWIDWSRLPPQGLETAAVTRGGGAGPWGNYALAGTIRLTSRVPTEPGADANADVNSFGSANGTASLYARTDRARIAATIAGHAGPGDYLIRADQRGPIDRRTDDRGALARVTAAVTAGPDTEITLAGAASSDRFINGIDIARSRVRTEDGAVGVVHDPGPGAVGWELHGYVRDENQPAMFASVNAGRTAATPSLNQFAVPARAYGGVALVRVPLSSTLSVDVGGDVRRVSGATHEDFQFANGAFTRVRDAGGAQTVGGAFVEGNWLPRESLTVTGSARIDGWRQSDGHRLETPIGGGAVLRDDHYAAASGTLGSFRLGARLGVTDAVALRAAAYSGFRVPTLNELYRPFRVGNDITEANPALRPERMTGAEAGMRWQAAPGLTVDLTAFVARLRDAVGNVTVRAVPGLDPTLGVVVPVGGTLRQRQNIARTKAEGVEAEAVWAMTGSLDLTARYLYTAPRIARSPAQPGLEGLTLAEVSRHQATIGVDWRPWAGGAIHAEGRAQSGQFDDDLNTRRLSGYATADLSLEQAVGSHATLFVNCDNLFDRTIEAGRSADGIVTVATGRSVAAGVRLRL